MTPLRLKGAVARTGMLALFTWSACLPRTGEEPPAPPPAPTPAPPIVTPAISSPREALARYAPDQLAHANSGVRGARESRRRRIARPPNSILAAAIVWPLYQQARDMRDSNNAMAALAHLASEQRYHVEMSRDLGIMA